MSSSWLMVRRSDGVVFKFTGRLSTADGIASAHAFAEVLAVAPTKVLWDLRAMQGYETGARVAWQRALWPHRHNLESVEVVGGGPFVRLGAITLTTALGVPLTFRHETPDQPGG